MKLFQIRSADSGTREHLFAEKYAWLLGWALHFAHNDHATAEDLVQDTFVRFVLAETDLKSTENIEALLYTYLKYACEVNCTTRFHTDFDRMAALCAIHHNCLGHVFALGGLRRVTAVYQLGAC